MRTTVHLEANRMVDPLGRPQSGMNGCFGLRCPETGRELNCFASDEGGWEHVSVSLHRQRNKCPSWVEMEWVRRQFFEPDEAVMQIHAPVADYETGYTPTQVLHLWRPTEVEIPLPPREFV